MDNNKPEHIDLRNCEQRTELITSLQHGGESFRSMVNFLTVSWAIYAALLLLDSIHLGSLELALKNDAAIFFWFGAIGLYISYNFITESRDTLKLVTELELDGINAAGMVIDKWRDLNTDWELNYIGYKFSYMNNIYMGRRRVTPEQNNKLHVGDHVVIRFLPHEPQTSFMQLD